MVPMPPTQINTCYQQNIDKQWLSGSFDLDLQNDYWNSRKIVVSCTVHIKQADTSSIKQHRCERTVCNIPFHAASHSIGIERCDRRNSTEKLERSCSSSERMLILLEIRDCNIRPPNREEFHYQPKSSPLESFRRVYGQIPVYVYIPMSGRHAEGILIDFHPWFIIEYRICMQRRLPPPPPSARISK